MIHFRTALRSLTRTPGLSAAVIVTIALGVGASSSIFSIAYAVLFRPLPYRDADRLVMVWESRPVEEGTPADSAEARLARRSHVNSRNLPAWREQSRSFEVLAGYGPHQYSLTGTSNPERLNGLAVTREFFDALGVRPFAGRFFEAAEEVPGQDEVVVLSHGLWARRFGSDRRVIGQTVGIDGKPHRVIGILPPDLRLVLPYVDREPALMTTVPHKYWDGRAWTLLLAVGRLRPAVALEAAQAEMSSLARNLWSSTPRSAGRDVNLVPLWEEMARDSRRTLLILLGATLLVALIGCVNVANLLFVRAVGRERDLAVRAALGAGRLQLLRGVLVESGLLAVAGGAAGLVLAWWGSDLIVALMPPQMFPRVGEVRIDRAVLLFGLAVSLVSGLVAGILPAWQMTRRDRRGALTEGLTAASRGSLGSRRHRRVRQGLVAAEIALATILLVGAALLGQTYLRLTRADLGIRTDRILTFGLTLPTASYSNDSSRTAFIEALDARLATVPSVDASGLTSALPVRSAWVYSSSVGIEGLDPDNWIAAPVRSVTPGFLKAFNVRTAYGRLLTPQDVSAKVAVVNRALVGRLWPSAPATGPEPIGRLLFVARQTCRIVGVIEDVSYDGPGSQVEPEVYVPYAVWPVEAVAASLRISGDPAALVPAVHAAVRAIDADLPLESVRSMDEVIAETVAPPRFRLAIVGAFAALALVLAVVGLYGVVAQSVAQRSGEIGLRMALGAARSTIAAMVLADGLIVTLIGLAGGVGVSLAVTRVLAGFLFGVTPTDAPTLAAVSVLLLAVAAAASWLPAHRAAAVDPAIALRSE